MNDRIILLDRLLITTLDQPVVCMYYRFFQNIERKSLLLCGDMGGSVKVFEFSSAEGGPFKQRLGENFSLVRYSDVILGSINGLEVWELRGLHKNWVKQVYCYKSAARLASCANHSGASLTIGYGPQDNHRIQFNVDKGISTFDIDEGYRHLVATGCANHEVRLWDTEAPGRALAVFTGHMTSIASVLLDSVENRTYSLSRDRVIRVWDNRTKECIQTFCEKLHDLGPPVPMVTLFNPDRRTWMIGAFHMALLKVGNVVDPNYSEGYTHSRPVTKALYNTLFKCLITVGMDSCIMTWQPLTGKRTYIIQNAHTRYVYGEKEAIGITAATYNSSKLFLMTGAMDGTVKMWNFNAGTCLRNMSIEENCCVTDIVWIPGRILAIGWNRHVTEWEDTTKIGNSKDWRSYHKEDILASVFCPPNTIATTSCAGELVFCRLETGQSFKRFNVAVPGVV
ncbi:hypothetical protein AAG570_011424 [Ranatra chinensis]|uniref:WD repeat-containing protein on Y chromosome n=1 Tax=Ranatra chinensis TaxID=642074 RepID=A0ABD0YYT9_9HEMI